MEYFTETFGTHGRLMAVATIVLITHLFVFGVRFAVNKLMASNAIRRWAKVRTIIGLALSIAIFSMYFIACGLALKEFGVSLTAYLASASVIGLAIGFGSQGVVQDVVTGLTVIFSDLMQVGDVVEISGQVGEVQSVGMRFTVLLNPMGAQVYIPNRTLANIIVYPRGYVRCFTDITIPNTLDTETEALASSKLEQITEGITAQYQGIIRSQPEIDGITTMPSGRRFIRVKFRIWPGRSAPIESAFKAEVTHAMKSLDSSYMDWMVSVNNEVSERPRILKPYRSVNRKAPLLKK